MTETGEREVETEEGIEMIGRATRTENEKAGADVGVEVEREIEEKIGTGIMIMTEVESTDGTGIVIGTGIGSVIEKCRNVPDSEHCFCGIWLETEVICCCLGTSGICFELLFT